MKELREMLGLLKTALAERGGGGAAAAAPEDDLRDLERQIARQKKVAQVRFPCPVRFRFLCASLRSPPHPGTRPIRCCGSQRVCTDWEPFPAADVQACLHLPTIAIVMCTLCYV